MRFDENPVFKKIIVTWYDSEAACYLIIGVMMMVLLFALAGVFVAMESPGPRRHIWVPVVLITLSGYMVVSAMHRLLNHYSPP